MLRDLRADALKILKNSLNAVDPAALLKRHAQREGRLLRICDSAVNLNEVRRLVVIGAGKGTAPLAAAAEEILGDRISSGAIVVKYGHALPLSKIHVFQAGHPIPDHATVAATRHILKLLKGLEAEDIVLVLITGGGSALLELPVPGVTLDDIQETTSELLACGAEIGEINAVRKHLSRVKGGQLLRFAHPARVITLAISDVIGNFPESIASGPTVPDPTAFADVHIIIEKYDLFGKLPKAILEHLVRGLAGQILDTPKPADPIFADSQFHLIGDNRMMLQGAKSAAKNLGYQAEILTDSLRGEACLQGRRLASIIMAAKPQDKPICLLCGGETTVTLTDPYDLVVQASLPALGLGGRNQELALAAAIELAGIPNCLILSAGSDGTDGPTDAAGAIADGTTLARAAALSLDASDHLTRNDSYNFFKPLNDLIITGPTLTNVMDLVVMLKS